MRIAAHRRNNSIDDCHFWTIMAVFETAGKRVGSLAVNFIRLVTGFIMLSIFVYFRRGYLLPTDATLHNWTWLGISGLVGFFLQIYSSFRPMWR